MCDESASISWLCFKCEPLQDRCGPLPDSQFCHAPMANPWGPMVLACCVGPRPETQLLPIPSFWIPYSVLLCTCDVATWLVEYGALCYAVQSFCSHPSFLLHGEDKICHDDMPHFFYKNNIDLWSTIISVVCPQKYSYHNCVQTNLDCNKQANVVCVGCTDK